MKNDKKVTQSLKAGEKFSMVGVTDGVKRVYTCVARTIATFLTNGKPAFTQNVIAENHETGKNTVFAFTSLNEIADKA